MIKFFRKIRQKWAYENNISKYSRYAIGEIVLVVIGILIALYINDLNKSSQNRNEARFIKKALLEDLQHDVLNINISNSKIENDIKHIKQLIDRYSSETATFDTILATINEFNPIIYPIQSFRTSTFESLISTGKIELLENELRVLLIENHKLQLISLEKFNQQLYMEKTSIFNSRYYFGAPRDNFVNRLVRTIEDPRDITVKFTTMCGFKSFMHRTQLTNQKNVLEKTQEIILLLNPEINQSIHD